MATANRGRIHTPNNETPFEEYQELVLTNNLDVTGRGTNTNFVNSISATALDNKITHMCLTEIDFVQRTPVPFYPIPLDSLNFSVFYGDGVNHFKLGMYGIVWLSNNPIQIPGGYIIAGCPGLTADIKFNEPITYSWPPGKTQIDDYADLVATLEATVTEFKASLTDSLVATAPVIKSSTAGWRDHWDVPTGQNFVTVAPAVDHFLVSYTPPLPPIPVKKSMCYAPLTFSPNDPPSNPKFATSATSNSWDSMNMVSPPLISAIKVTYTFASIEYTLATWDISYAAPTVTYLDFGQNMPIPTDISTNTALTPVNFMAHSTLTCIVNPDQNPTEFNTLEMMGAYEQKVLKPKSTRMMRLINRANNYASKNLQYANSFKESFAAPQFIFQIICPNLELSYLAAGQSVNILKTLIIPGLPTAGTTTTYRLTMSQVEWKPVNSTSFASLQIIICDATGDEHAYLANLAGEIDVYLKIRFRNTPNFPEMAPYATLH